MTAPNPLTRALETIKRLKAQLDAQGSSQPLAVIGAGLRLPGGIDTLDGYWAALSSGRDMVASMPEARKAPFAAEWEALPHKGGFLDEVLGFDANFFGISPREARALDPQHRLLLEVAWEALENAGLPPDRLTGARTGLYVGITGQDYRDWQHGPLDAYWATGNGHCFAAGRIAYTLGLTGPAVALDTACSSSLVAVHLASQALRRGECDVALVGGVNLILSPRSTRLVKETRSLAPDGLCKTFDARANGFTRGEGCGVIVLKRLDHATRDGDRVIGVIRGSAVNQDGRSSGFTAPNVLAQINLIEAALADAGLTPADIGLIEAHGTGTSLGDPIEMEAILTALGQKNGGAKLSVGSVKTNIGHLESAAGIAGLIKALLCIQRKAVPPLVHFKTLNPRIDLGGTGITLPTALTPWQEGNARCAGVSSFGMSGTNAHVILGPVEAGEAAATSPSKATGFELSAKTPEALRVLARRLGERLASIPAEEYAAFAYTVTFGRARLGHRARIVAADKAAAAAALKAVAEGATSASVTLLEGERAAGEDAAGILPRRVVDLPSYPWERQRHAPEPVKEAPERTEAAVATSAAPAPLHEIAWHALAPAAAPDKRTLVLAGDDGEALSLLAKAGQTLGWTGIVLSPTAPNAPQGWTHAALPITDAGWDAFWAGRPADERAFLLLAMKASALPERAGAKGDFAKSGAALCTAVSVAVRSLKRASRGDVARQAYAVTQGVSQVKGQDPIASGDHGLLHGLSPVLGLECGASWGGIIDLPLKASARDAEALLRFAGSHGDEDQAAVRDGEVFAGRIRPVPAGFKPELPVQADATYIITGGLGGIGRALIADLTRRGAKNLLLIGRKPEASLDAAAAGILGSLRGEGINIVYRSADCDDGAMLAEAFTVLRGMPPVRGIIHGAGTIAPTPIAEVGAASFDAALRGKFTGAWWLHLLSREWKLDFFIQLSSVSALWGTEGYGAYAAANGGLDALAAYRSSLGLKTLSIAFGPWALDGMADAAGRQDLARMGVGALTPQSGCASLSASVPSGGPMLVACPVDWPRFVEVMESRRRRALFSEVMPRASGPAPVKASAPSLLTGLLALPESARAGSARVHVGRMVAGILGHADARSIREDAGFFDLGLDSIMAVDLTRELADAFGLELKATDIFDHPTIASLAEFVVSRIAVKPAAAPAVVQAPAERIAPAPQPVAPAAVAVQAPVAPAPVAPAAPAPVQVVGEAAPREGRAMTQEPIAIVGMAGRFPGADSTEELWSLLREGRDAVGPVPSERWDIAALHDTNPLNPGKITTDQGGFLKDLSRFDASFFHIPAREAESLDPQHRLLLEVAWHALEDGAIDPKGLKGTRTGVFVGISNSDYARLLEQGGLEQLDAYFGTGTALNAAAGRIAYLLGLNGPALAVDTACSSSLVALHLAARSLRLGETECALAGGVNVLTAPSCSVAVSRAHMLSPEGRCKTFSADANGFVRAEGCGVLVLKRLSDAQRDGNRILAVIHGSAINQDGASSGLTVPSGKAQEAVISAALADAAINGSAVSYLEAHGTGTSLGDPIEVAAAWAALGSGRKSDEPLHLGSVKSNIGHSESAAGMASVIKTVLALKHRQLPASLHCRTLNPHVAWNAMNVRVVDSLTPWRSNGKPRFAGVSGFGFSGTNAHLVLGEAPAPAPAPEALVEGPLLMPLSAPDGAGLTRVAEAWARAIDGASNAELASLAVTAGAGRAHLTARKVFLGKTKEELLTALKAPIQVAGQARQPRVAFLFSGQGSQYFGMGRDLYESEPVFRDVVDTCDRLLSPHLGAPLKELMLYGADKELINQTRVTQPALVVLELALAALWESWGVTAAAVIGHSVGEIAAAIHAGVMDLEAGLLLIAHRARLMQGTERGAMLALAAPLARVTEWIQGTELDVATINGPEAVVVAGRPEAVDAFAAKMKELKVTARPLVVSHAFHSRLMDPMLADFRAAIAPFSFRAPKLPIIANLTGKLATPGEYHADYWCQHVRQPVRFFEGAQALSTLDVDVCLEVGPDRTLGNLITAAKIAPAGGTLASLRRGTKDRGNLVAAAKALYEQGQDLAWEKVQAATGGGRASAPLYPFAETRYWTKVTPRQLAAPGASAAPLKRHWGSELKSPFLKGRVFAFERSAEFPRYLTDHRLYGTVVTPAASHLGTILSALGSEGKPVTIEDLICPRALVIKDGENYDVQILVGEGGQASSLSVQSLLDAEQKLWQEHLSGRLVAAASATQRTPPDRQAFISSAERHITGKAFYAYFRELGYTLGPSFRWIADVWIRGEEAIVRYEQPTLPDDPASYEIYPGLIDSCFQSIAGFMVDDDAQEAASLAIPFAATKLSFHSRAQVGKELWGHVRVKKADALPRGRVRVETADLHMFTEAGTSLFIADDFRVRHAPRAVLEQSLRAGAQQAYSLSWMSPPRWEERATGSRRILVGNAGASFGAALREALKSLGHDAHLLPAGAAVEGPADLFIDAGFAEINTEAGAGAAQQAAISLTEALKARPRNVPQAVLGDGRVEASPVREAVWGMLAALEAEDGERRLVRITLEPGWSAGTLAAYLSQALAQAFPETRVAVGGNGVQVARLTPVAAAAPAPQWDGSVLVTGGLGALGLSVAQILSQQGAKVLTLMGRSAPDATAQRVIDELTKGGVRVILASGDVTDPAACERAVASSVAAAPLCGVFHLAGINDDQAFERLTPASFQKVFAAKAHGAQTLAAAVRGQPLKAFVLFSSVSSAIGSAGQVNYAAANGYLDGLAQALRAAGVPATSVNWGPWVPSAKGGMAASAAVAKAVERIGIRPLTDDEAAPILALASNTTQTRLIAVSADFNRYSAHLKGHPRAALVSGLISETRPANAPAASGKPKGWLQESLKSLEAEPRDDGLRDAIRTMVSDVLGQAAAIDDGLGFADMGLDSIMVIDLRTRLAHALGVDLPATVAIDHPNVPAMARFLAGLVFPAVAVAAPAAVAPAAPVPAPTAAPEAGEPGSLSLDQLIKAIQDDLAAAR
jgi:acyl transferase domain-containing protein/acyl carrier protein